MKKTIALFIAAFILLGAMPAAADTDLTIDTVRVTNVSAPLAGAKPDYTAYSDTYGMSLLDYSNRVTVNGLAWFDVEGDFYLEPDDTFVKGRIYEARIYVASNGVYRFAVDSNGKPAVKAYVNGYSVEAYSSVPSSVNGGKRDASRYLLLYYRFPACAASPIEYVPLLVGEPVSGDHPVFSACAAKSNAGFTVTADFDAAGFTNGVMWEVKNGDTYSRLTASDVFVAGRTYAVTVRISAEAGRYFRLDTNSCPYAACKINGKNSYIYNSPVQSSPGSIAVVTREFVCSARSIDSVSVTGTFTPESGGRPCFDAYPESSGYQAISVKWTDPANGETLTENDTFVEERTYMLEIVLRPMDGCTFSSGAAGLINGSAAETEIQAGTGNIVLKRSYVCPESKTISVVRIEGVVLPHVGSAPVYAASVPESAKYELDFSQDDAEEPHGTVYYIKNAVQWADRMNNMAFGDIYVGGTDYAINVFVCAKEGYRFAEFCDATVNGYEASCLTDYIDARTAMITLYFERLPSVTVSEAAVAVTAPKTGDQAVFAAVPQSAAYEVYDHSSGAFIHGVAWYDKTAESYLKEGDAFVSGHEYRVYVTLRTADAGYVFDRDPDGKSTVTGSINGMKCDVDSNYLDSAERITLAGAAGAFSELDLADFDGSGKITSDDAVYLLRHTLFPGFYPINPAHPFYGDRSPTSDDAVYLLRYTLFPAQYDLLKYAVGAG